MLLSSSSDVSLCDPAADVYSAAAADGVVVDVDAGGGGGGGIIDVAVAAAAEEAAAAVMLFRSSMPILRTAKYLQANYENLISSEHPVVRLN